MKKVFKVLKLLVKWMRLGMYEFSSLPFVTKVEMQEDNRTRLRSIRKIHKGKCTSIIQYCVKMYA